LKRTRDSGQASLQPDLVRYIAVSRPSATIRQLLISKEFSCEIKSVHYDSCCKLMHTNGNQSDYLDCLRASSSLSKTPSDTRSSLSRSPHIGCQQPEVLGKRLYLETERICSADKRIAPMLSALLTRIV